MEKTAILRFKYLKERFLNILLITFLDMSLGGYSTESNNLILVGTEENMNELELQLGRMGIPVTRINEVLEYPDLPEIVQDRFDDEPEVYLVAVWDSDGKELGELGAKMKRYLTFFETVDGVFEDEGNGKLRHQRIKERGSYIPAMHRKLNPLDV